MRVGEYESVRLSVRVSEGRSVYELVSVFSSGETFLQEQ